MAGKSRSGDDADVRVTRRRFTAECKARILAEYEAAPDGEKGAVLRRERLYHSHILDWRNVRDVGVSAGLADRRESAQRARKSAEAVEV